MHDISAMTLAANFPKQCDELLKKSSEEQGYDELESVTFEISRGALIDWVANSLHMPSVTVEATKLLYGVEMDEENDDARRQSSILALAHTIDQQLHQNDLLVIRQHQPLQVDKLRTLLGLSEEQLDEVIEESREKLSERFMF